MKQIYQSFKIAFSMYSKIPMPKSDWTPENKRYVTCFFPAIGLVIGALYSGWFFLYKLFPDFHEVFYAAVAAVLPIVVTGGIHMDGFLDTVDALASWQPRERRLEILKDSNAGAFAVIGGACYLVLSLGAAVMISDKSIWVISCGFIMSRSFSGLSVLTFKPAKKNGSLTDMSNAADKKIGITTLLFWLCAAVAGMILTGGGIGVIAVLAGCVVFIYYRHMAAKYFGGTTGDLAGYFLQCCELAVVIAAVCADVIIRSVLR